MGIFETFKNGLKKTRGFVADGFTKISAGIGKYDEEMLDELEALLVQADVGVKASLSIMDSVRLHIRQTGDDSAEAVLFTVNKCMIDILGEKKQLRIEDGSLNILLLVGVNGTGKTTTAGKLCMRYQSQGKKVMLAAADTFRAAAIEQLQAWGDKTGTPVISQTAGSDPAAVCYDAVHAAIARRTDVLIIDTAGRLHNKQNLMDELAKISKVIDREAPSARIQSLLVIDATTGQNAVIQAEVFSGAINIHGIVITKLDGSAKGGVAIAVAHKAKAPILLAGLGESVEDLVDFDPELFVNSLLPSP